MKNSNPRLEFLEQKRVEPRNLRVTVRGYRIMYSFVVTFVVVFSYQISVRHAMDVAPLLQSGPPPPHYHRIGAHYMDSHVALHCHSVQGLARHSGVYAQLLCISEELYYMYFFLLSFYLQR